MIILIDNYDSFTYNLYQYFGELRQAIEVVRNDATTVDAIAAQSPTAVVMSPGPGNPKDAGICLTVVRELSGKIPILGICLGHQVIAEAFGGAIIHAPLIFHGKTSRIVHDNSPLYQGLPKRPRVGRYHSLIVEADTLPAALEVTARTDDTSSVIMGLRHKRHPTEGIQFHPESILTEHGKRILQNFVNALVPIGDNKVEG